MVVHPICHHRMLTRGWVGSRRAGARPPTMEDVADGMEDAGGGDSDYPQEEKEGGRVGRRAQNPGSARRRASVDRRRAEAYTWPA